MFLELSARLWLCKDIRRHCMCWTVCKFDHSMGHMVSDEVQLKVDIFSTGVVFGVLCNCNGLLVITI